MGLDMYLTRQTYVQNWNHTKPENRVEITINKGRKPHPKIDPSKITYITEEVGYWRKANHIHKWFVDNVQDGIDECQRSYVSFEQLQELKELCKSVLGILETSEVSEKEVVTGWRHEKGETKEIKEMIQVYDSELISALLPPESGFFFGSTDIGEWYKKDLEDTISILENLDPEGSYYYEASW